MALAPGRNQFDVARERAAQRSSADAQATTGAIQRRFASMGGLNSGASIKAQQIAQQQAQAQREDAIAGVDAAQQQYAEQLAESERGRAFQASQSGLDRGFQGEQNALARALQARQLDMQGTQFDKQFDLQGRQFDFQKDESAFNRRLAKYQAGRSGGLLGGGGFLGTGIGAKDVKF